MNSNNFSNLSLSELAKEIMQENSKASAYFLRLDVNSKQAVYDALTSQAAKKSFVNQLAICSVIAGKAGNTGLQNVITGFVTRLDQGICDYFLARFQYYNNRQ